jgi:hypothetical protein
VLARSIERLQEEKLECKKKYGNEIWALSYLNSSLKQFSLLSGIHPGASR